MNAIKSVLLEEAKRLKKLSVIYENRIKNLPKGKHHDMAT